MDTLTALALGEANRGKEMMVFDWDEAARIIVREKTAFASAGLSGDWEWTGGEILLDGKPVSREDTYVYLASTWARPELQFDGDEVACYIMESEARARWGAKIDCASVYWPQSALDILAGKEIDAT